MTGQVQGFTNQTILDEDSRRRGYGITITVGLAINNKSYIISYERNLDHTSLATGARLRTDTEDPVAPFA